ncbi:DDE superfamily endonuclease domain-containing protein [Phthorimaea operculella]|nr:DDE superfamily endonuclease domain-containing protein [Phthorimaea operculella]
MAPKKNYTPLQMAKAIEAVKGGEKISTAANKYGVPRITLYDKISGKTPVECSMGPSTYLSTEEEAILEKWILDMAEKHIPITRDELLDSVQRIIADQKRKTPFTDNRPGRKWYNLFLKRHPAISERTAQNLTTARDAVTEENLKSWFKEVESYIQENNLKEASEDPRRIFNTDESAFYLSPKAGKVLAKKGDKHIYQSSGDEKDNLTVLITGNAAGELAPTMVVFAYERVPSAISSRFPEEWYIGRSPSGWMCGATFFEYIANKFNPWLVQQNIPKPVLFFLDGHRSHLTLYLSNFCAENGIEIIALYPNSTHILQPMDLAVFRPLKYYWKKAVKEWKLQHLGQNLQKENFALVLKTALQSITESSIKNGFRAGGLYPFGPDYVDVTKIKSRSTPQISSEQKDFFNYLEREIVAKFGAEKMLMFKELFYKGRDELNSRLNEEDISLYVIWASNKQAVESSDHVNEPFTSGRSLVEISNLQVNEDVSSVTNTRTDIIASQTQQMSQEQLEFNRFDSQIDHDYIHSNPLKEATVSNNSALSTSETPTDYQETREKFKNLDVTAVASDSCVLADKPVTTAVASISCASINNPIPIATASTSGPLINNSDTMVIACNSYPLTSTNNRNLTAAASTLCISTNNLDPTVNGSTFCALTNSQDITATYPTLGVLTHNPDSTAITSTSCNTTNNPYLNAKISTSCVSTNVLSGSIATEKTSSNENRSPIQIISTCCQQAAEKTPLKEMSRPGTPKTIQLKDALTNRQDITATDPTLSASTYNPDSTAITCTSCNTTNNPYLNAKISTSCVSTNVLSGSIATEKTSSNENRSQIQIISTCSQQASEKTPLKEMSRPGTSKTIQLKDGSTIIVPSPFKRHIFWPGEDEEKKGRKRKCKEKIPYAITSQSWRDYHNKKDKEKREKEEQKEIKAKEREEKRQLKLREIENKKQKQNKEKEKTQQVNKNKAT